MQPGMVFALVFAIIMIGFIFAFALPQIGSLMSIGGQAQINKMIKDIESKVDQLYWNAGFGSSEILTISLPGDARLCFINPNNLENRAYAERWMDWKQDDAIKFMIEREGYNLWYYSSEGQNGYKVEHLQLDSNQYNFCTKSGIDIYLENQGNKVAVSLVK